MLQRVLAVGVFLGVLWMFWTHKEEEGILGCMLAVVLAVGVGEGLGS